MGLAADDELGAARFAVSFGNGHGYWRGRWRWGGRGRENLLVLAEIFEMLGFQRRGCCRGCFAGCCRIDGLGDAAADGIAGGGGSLFHAQCPLEPVHGLENRVQFLATLASGIFGEEPAAARSFEHRLFDRFIAFDGFYGATDPG